jgi:hypothetical protein
MNKTLDGEYAAIYFRDDLTRGIYKVLEEYGVEKYADEFLPALDKTASNIASRCRHAGAAKTATTADRTELHECPLCHREPFGCGACLGTGIGAVDQPCSVCHGSGVSSESCPVCEGAGARDMAALCDIAAWLCSRITPFEARVLSRARWRKQLTH